MTAFEAGLMIGDSIGGQEIDEMDSLLACLAFVLGATEGHGEGTKLLEFFLQSITNEGGQAKTKIINLLHEVGEEIWENGRKRRR